MRFRYLVLSTLISLGDLHWSTYLPHYSSWMEQCLEFFITFVKTNIKLGLYNYHMPTFFMAPMLILVIYLDIKEIYFVLLAVKCQPLAINMQNLWCTYLVGLKYNPPVAVGIFSTKSGMNFIVSRVCCFWSNSLKSQISTCRNTRLEKNCIFPS